MCRGKRVIYKARNEPHYLAGTDWIRIKAEAEGRLYNAREQWARAAEEGTGPQLDQLDALIHEIRTEIREIMGLSNAQMVGNDEVRGETLRARIKEIR